MLIKNSFVALILVCAFFGCVHSQGAYDTFSHYKGDKNQESNKKENITLAPIINIDTGLIQGKVLEYRGNQVYYYLGIPYAQSPTGKRRFRKPVPMIPWSGVRKTIEYGQSCLQYNEPIIHENETSENCLFLNVFTSEFSLKSRSLVRKPVMVWIHGGAFNHGSGNERNVYQGIPIVVEGDIVLVTFNYRLNVFGFLRSTRPFEPEIEGNMGLWDQVEALKWVKQNIASFGGDPNSVTIFGESAGSMSVSLLIVSPLTAGLFHNAIMQSGSSLSIDLNPGSDVPKYSDELINSLGCNVTQALECLSNLDSEVIRKAVKSSYKHFNPIYGDILLPNTVEEALKKGKYHENVNILLGVEKDEGLWLLTEIYPKNFDPNVTPILSYEDGLKYLVDRFGAQNADYYAQVYLGSRNDTSSKKILNGVGRAFGDTVLTCPTFVFGHDFVKYSKNRKGKVFAYIHTQEPTISFIETCTKSPWLGVCHTDDIPFVFGVPLKNIENYSKHDIILSLNMMNIWSVFAHTGETPKQGAVPWPPFLPDSDGNIFMTAIELESQRLGNFISEPLLFCLKYWPFRGP